jgi:cyclic lactone autoinducer peptide
MKIGELISAAALDLGVASIDTVCVIMFHQPKAPQGMEKFKKKK